MNELALFAGAGGGILGGRLLGWRTVGAVELERYPREVLLARQRDGMLDKFPIWDDVRTFDGRPWRGLVDVVSGGFPCQDISAAGKGAGIEGERSGLWKEMLRIIREVRPRYAFMENSPMLTSRGLGVVLGDLAEAGYNAEWMVLGAADVGAPHQRDRIWILAYDAERGELFPHADLHGTGWGQQLTQGAAQKAGEECVAEHADLHDERAEQAISGGGQAADTEGVCEAVGQHAPSPDTDAHGVQCTEQGSEHQRTEELAGGGTHGLEAGGYVPHADKPQCKGADGLPEQCEPQDSGTGVAGGIWCAGDGWTVEPDVGRSFDGLACKLDKNQHLSHEAKEHGKEILRNLWKGDFPQAVREAFGGFSSVSEEEILLAILCQYDENANGIRVQVESGAAPQADLRSLWHVIEAARASYKWQHSGQYAGEYSNALRIVSRKAPSLYSEAWLNGSWESGIPRVLDGVAARVDRLKAIGNGQVPLVAATAFTILMTRIYDYEQQQRHGA